MTMEHYECRCARSELAQQIEEDQAEAIRTKPATVDLDKWVICKLQDAIEAGIAEGQHSRQSETGDYIMPSSVWHQIVEAYGRTK